MIKTSGEAPGIGIDPRIISPWIPSGAVHAHVKIDPTEPEIGLDHRSGSPWAIPIVPAIPVGRVDHIINVVGIKGVEIPPGDPGTVAAMKTSDSS